MRLSSSIGCEGNYWYDCVSESETWFEDNLENILSKDDRLTVWSSERGDLRKKSRKENRAVSLPPEQQTAYIHRESKGRGGKTVTLVKNLVLSEGEMKSLAKTIKQACGSGGTVKEGVIEIQGEQREKIAGVLRGLGYKVKLAGG